MHQRALYTIPPFDQQDAGFQFQNGDGGQIQTACRDTPLGYVAALLHSLMAGQIVFELSDFSASFPRLICAPNCYRADVEMYPA